MVTSSFHSPLCPTSTAARLILGSALICGAPQAMALSLTADVDTKQVAEGDSFNLTVTVNERAFGKEPDFGVLEEHFTIANRYQSNQVQIINGEMKSNISWRLTLIPKTTGLVVIPPITLESATTNPITIQVTKASSNGKKIGNDNVFIEASVDKKTAYVQEQIVLKLRLYKRTQIIDASWPPPTIPDAVVETLSEARVFQSTVGKHTYNVTEYTFSVFPQKSGEIVIPASKLVASIGNGNQRGGFFFDPYAASKKISRSTQPITLNIKPIPDNYPKGAHWLPSQAVALGERWSEEPPKFTVGEAITRTVILQAKGLTGTALPEIPVPSSDRYKVYPDKSETRGNTNADGTLSQRISSYAFIPTQPGPMTLPAINISWWDIDNDKLQTATLPAQTITVQPASNTSTANKGIPELQAAPESLDTGLPTPPSLSSSDETASPWRWVALLLGLLWAATLGAGYWFYKRLSREQPMTGPNLSVKPHTLSLKAASRELQKACDNNDPKAATAALLKWGQALLKTQKPNSLGELKQHLNSDALKNSITALEALRYREENGSSWQGADLWNAVSTYTPSNSADARSKTATTLEPLHRA